MNRAAAPASSTASATHRPSRWRWWALRLGSVGFGLSLLVLTEIGLWALDWGHYQDAGDPFVGFSEIVPLFELSSGGTLYQIAPARLNWFQPDTFAAEKPEDEFRIFCFGGSTVQGRPYSIETAFTRWLELTLRAAEPDRPWRVVNCGGVSYASYRLLPIMRETRGYAPDLFVVYTGHNEFLEDRTYADLKTRPAWLRSLQETMLWSRIYGLAQQSLPPARPVSDPTTLPADVDARLDYRGGLELYHRDGDWRQGVAEHYEHNLRRMVWLSREANIPLLFVNPVSNVRDTPPFKHEDVPGPQAAEVQEAWTRATTADWADLSIKEELVRRVLQLDPEHANAHFLLGRVQEQAGEFAAARRSYERAKDTDVCPLRMLEEMHDRLRRVAEDTGTPLIDVRQTFRQQAEHGIPGDGELVDHVHPKLEGHQWIAADLFDFLVRNGTVHPQSDWESRRDHAFRVNIASLPNNYFPQAQSRLEGLRTWAAGRVQRMRLPANAPASRETDASAPPGSSGN